VLKIPSALTDVGIGQVTTTMAYDNLKETDVCNSGVETHRSEIVQEVTNYQELYTGLCLNCCDFFYLEDFVGGIGIMLLKFRLLRSPDTF